MNRCVVFGPTAYRVTLYKYSPNYNEEKVITIFDPRKINGFGVDCLSKKVKYEIDKRSHK